MDASQAPRPRREAARRRAESEGNEGKDGSESVSRPSRKRTGRRGIPHRSVPLPLSHHQQTADRIQEQPASKDSSKREEDFRASRWMHHLKRQAQEGWGGRSIASHHITSHSYHAIPTPTR
ncbi:hypothetical protein BU26DRAFT_522698 [Trematosphaeria pertusa]|uniref:Uncharacterized protein n=1 Tax=Trematosphaeria pertusa TaxID=390896 RepID=A0A6A6I4W9_9PLEO|nr:uncharacterized protein BU26DRAFT_522698 [Trematosphaeria pertusa]KAF2245002.1 hypothetical protein BU26DRAFT_522698 [Trematosphaeria pertusa]